MCFHPHKILKNGCNTHRWIELMFQVFVRHSAQLLALIELPDCPKHCFETRWGQDLVKGMCPAFRDEHTSSSPTGMYRCGLGSCHKAEEREDQGGDGGGRNICDLQGCIDQSLSAGPSGEDCTVPKLVILWGHRLTIMGQVGLFDQVRKIWETVILEHCPVPEKGLLYFVDQSPLWKYHKYGIPPVSVTELSVVPMC